MELFVFTGSGIDIRIYNIKTVTRNCTLNVDKKWRSSSNRDIVLFSRDSKLVALNHPQHVVIWKLELPSSKPSLIKKPYNRHGEYENVAFSDDSKSVAASWRTFLPTKPPFRAPLKHLIFIWNTDTGAPRAIISILDWELIRCRPSKLSFGPNDRWLIAGFCCITMPNSDPNSLDGNASRNVLSNAQYLGFRYNSLNDLSWIEFKGKRALYIPSDYRPSYRGGGGVDECSVNRIEITRSASTSPVATTTIAVWSRTGRIWMTKLSETEFEKETMNGGKNSDTIKIKYVVALEKAEHERRRKRRQLYTDRPADA